MFQYRQVLVRLRQGDSDRDVARSRLMGRPKVAALRALAISQGWLTLEAPLPDDATIAALIGRARRARSTVSTLEPYRAQIERWAQQGVGGVAIHSALAREHAYRGSYSAVRRILAGIRASQPPAATVPLYFAPAEAAQVDFGAGPFLFDPARGESRRTWCFVMTLCFSRHQYVEFVFDQTVMTWLGCHRRAFEWFARVPERVIIDNPKCAITRACVRDPLVQRAYAECAEGYSFKIDPCPPADPAKKGVVEAGVKYVKGNFLPTRTFRDLTDLNEQAWRWVLEEAGVRIHGTTHERPLERFAIEQPLMRELPPVAPDLGAWHRVKLHRDCHVKFDYALYSAPFTLIGQYLWLRATDVAVSIFQDYRLIATHLRCRRRGERRTVPDHGPSCSALIEQLLGDRIVERLRGAQGTLRLADTYGRARLEAACQRALVHDSPHYRTVKSILVGGHDLKPLGARTDGSYVHGDRARFHRNAQSLFDIEHPDDDGVRH